MRITDGGNKDSFWTVNHKTESRDSSRIVLTVATTTFYLGILWAFCSLIADGGVHLPEHVFLWFVEWNGCAAHRVPTKDYRPFAVARRPTTWALWRGRERIKPDSNWCHTNWTVAATVAAGNSNVVTLKLRCRPQDGRAKYRTGKTVIAWGTPTHLWPPYRFPHK